MLKIRIIPVLTFNGFGLVKTKKFTDPRMVGNPVQAARVFNSRGVDELAFLDIFASEQKRKLNLNLVKDVIKECYMPVSIGGGITTLDDINDLLKIGADKVIIKTKAIKDKAFIQDAVRFFGSQCISISLDAYKDERGYKIFNRLDEVIHLSHFLSRLEECEVGELILNSVDNDGMMNGFDIDLIREVSSKVGIPIIAVGGGGNPEHFEQLFSQTSVEAAGAASIFYFTQFTPLDIKIQVKKTGRPVRI
jgi:cyclase